MVSAVLREPCQPLCMNFLNSVFVPRRVRVLQREFYVGVISTFIVTSKTAKRHKCTALLVERYE